MLNFALYCLFLSETSASDFSARIRALAENYCVGVTDLEAPSSRDASLTASFVYSNLLERVCSDGSILM
jgi:hypothetical protein